MYTMTSNKNLTQYIKDATEYLVTLEEGTPDWVAVCEDLDVMLKEQRIRRTLGEDTL